MWDRGLQGVGGMFGDLRRATNPYSNRMMLAGIGMLSGKNASEGWEGRRGHEGPRSGLGAGYRAQARARMQGLMNDPESGILSKLTEKERAVVAGDPELTRAVFAAGMPRSARSI